MTPLTNKTIAIARPAGQAEPLARLLEAEGAEALRFPILAIAPLADDHALRACADRLGDYDIAFFVSPNAVEHAMAAFSQRPWPQQLRVATVGPGSAQALRERGFCDVIVPSQRFDTEAVLALPEFSATAIRGRRVLILRGQHGRELLSETLRARGAHVDAIACYQRSGAALDAQPLVQRLHAGRLHGLVVTSSEALQCLQQVPGGAQLLAGCRLFVSHARIADTAASLGATRIVLTDPGDARIVIGIQEYFRKQENPS